MPHEEDSFNEEEGAGGRETYMKLSVTRATKKDI